MRKRSRRRRRHPIAAAAPLQLSMDEQLHSVRALLNAVDGHLMALTNHWRAVDLQHFVAHSKARALRGAGSHQFGDEQPRVVVLCTAKEIGGMNGMKSMMIFDPIHHIFSNSYLDLKIKG